MPTIRARIGHLEGHSFPLGDQQIVIGRDPSSDITLSPQSAASRRHAAVYPQNGRWRLQDLGSVNGSILNGTRIDDEELTHGDEIVIGEEVFTFEDDGNGSAAHELPEAEAGEAGELHAEEVPPEDVALEEPAAHATVSQYSAPPPHPVAHAVPAAPVPVRPAPAPMPVGSPEVQAMIRQMSERTKIIEKEIGKAIVGQLDIIRDMLTAVIARGHVLLIGMPGLAKTMLVRTLSEVLHLQFRRIQFTPDLMPSDITGTDILEVDEQTGKKEYRFIRGPIFSQILLADEINRTPPKTQAALLEAMQEYRVTASGQTFTLDAPFFVLATQNPLEQEGTYPLPEAQLDRFMFSIYVDYPSESEEEQIAKFTTSSAKVHLNRVLDAHQIIELQTVVRDLPVSDHVVKYAVRLVRSTRPADPRAPDFIKKWIRCGAGPRATQNLILAAKARAVIAGRMLVTTDDIRSIARPVLRHRMFTNFTADSEGMDTNKIVEKLLQSVEEPGEKDY